MSIEPSLAIEPSDPSCKDGFFENLFSEIGSIVRRSQPLAPSKVELGEIGNSESQERLYVFVDVSFPLIQYVKLTSFY